MLLVGWLVGWLVGAMICKSVGLLVRFGESSSCFVLFFYVFVLQEKVVQLVR